MSRIAQFDTQMLRDGYTISASMVYGYLWRTTWKSNNVEITPSFGLMQKSLNLGRATISRGINELESRGLIEVCRGYKERNTYCVIDLDNYPACVNYDEDRIGGGPKWNTGGPKRNR